MSEFLQNLRDYITKAVADAFKYNRYIERQIGEVCSGVNLNRHVLETDDAEEICRFLFDRYYKTVFDYVSKMMWNYPDPITDAEDITSETFTKAFNALKRGKEIQEPEELSGWLITIAINLTIDRTRALERRARYLPTESLDNLSVSEKEAPFASTLSDKDSRQRAANHDMKMQLLRLLSDKDREIAVLMDHLTPKAVAEVIGSTPGAVQKRWERLITWLSPVAVHLEALVECLPEERDRWIMERYLDGQPLSDIAKAIGISQSVIEETVKRVRAAWKKAAAENPTDPVSVMVKKER
ncbi:MAG: sigma-70 family RNA polymerase sigma factor [Candidatus Poribacteria bacterium]|nr:sigma-70 family RNA polymerase sigma factor [Candidatus Poribacteria bacterium]